MQYIGDAKAGTLVGKDQYVNVTLFKLCYYIIKFSTFYRFGNKYFENLNAEEEVPGWKFIPMYTLSLKSKDLIS